MLDPMDPRPYMPLSCFTASRTDTRVGYPYRRMLCPRNSLSRMLRPEVLAKHGYKLLGYMSVERDNRTGQKAGLADGINHRAAACTALAALQPRQLRRLAFEFLSWSWKYRTAAFLKQMFLENAFILLPTFHTSIQSQSQSGGIKTLV